jgi:nitrite reductase/ring-hydroxylating ferredoxin subunit
MPMDGGAVEGPYQAETFPVKVEADYVVVEV